jgi:large subunit ribosomal protein L4
MYRAGVAAILSQLAREDRLCVVDAFTVDSPKTKMLADKVKGMGFDDVLIVTDQLDENLFLSSRNLSYVGVLRVEQTDPLSLLQFDKVLFTRNAIARLEEILK